jgi:hypothetical protein
MNQKNRPARPGEATNVHRLRKLTGAAAQVSGRTHPYTDQERQEAVELAWQVGIPAAAEQLGINQGTLATWKDKARRDLEATRAEYLASGGELAEGEEPPDWRTQRELEANRAGLDARIVRDRATQAMLDGNDRLVRAGAAYYMALVDRAQVLTSGPAPKALTVAERAEKERRIVARWAREAEARGQTAAAEMYRTRAQQLEQAGAALQRRAEGGEAS